MLLKDNLKRVTQALSQVNEFIDSEYVKKKLLKLYFKSPSKIQFALARFGIKAVMNKKKEELEELIRH